ncbi:chromosome partitioning protein [Mariniflexile fucanivorans]|uniref:Chromosome partitioning protein n=1 Tax=Mariniflexile fucanivorans TaxID=264023 RepID=A0A4R1R9U6_9FLAO|nr:AAA family ATPase [Mariniflexile fucanivorans]TCL62504.1 chromosome partitioning protein [Mariniflexile fucanivorans]
MKATTIVFYNQKGGVGKTTTAINLAAQASMRGRTLLIDADNQGNLSLQFHLSEPKTSIRDLFLQKDFVPIEVRENLDVIPATLDFAGIDLEIQNTLSRELILSRALEPYKNKYEYIFIDCPPDISLVTVNVLSAADYVVIPIKAAQFSLDGVGGMIEIASKIKRAINPKLSILGLLLTHYDERLNITKDIFNVIKDNGWSADLFDTKIRVNTAIENAQFERKTIFEYDRKSNGAIDYASLGEELQLKIKKLQDGTK